MANHITLSIPHQLSRDEAKRRVEQLVARLQQQFAGGFAQLTESWDGNTMEFSLTAAGMTTRGTLAVELQVVRIDIAVPPPLAMLADGMKQTIQQEAQKLLGKS